MKALFLLLLLGLVRGGLGCSGEQGSGADNPAANEAASQDSEMTVEESDGATVEEGAGDEGEGTEGEDEGGEDCDPDAAGKMGTDSFSCPQPIKDVKGNTCCNPDLEGIMLDTAQGASDLKATAEQMRTAIQEQFQGEWQCTVSKGDIGYAGYLVGKGHCKISQENLYAVCWLNYLKKPC